MFDNLLFRIFESDQFQFFCCYTIHDFSNYCTHFNITTICFQNYIPELIREDIPQAMRGQRNVIFGNIEKIFEFHSQFFLQELERCEQAPLSIGQSFLRHVSNYNKTTKQVLLSDHMVLDCALLLI